MSNGILDRLAARFPNWFGPNATKWWPDPPKAPEPPPTQSDPQVIYVDNRNYSGNRYSGFTGGGGPGAGPGGNMGGTGPNSSGPSGHGNSGNAG